MNQSTGLKCTPRFASCLIVSFLWYWQIGRCWHLSHLFVDGEPAVRAKTCNLLGNLCRHSAFCYPALLRHALLPRLITRLTDSDRNTRKFACFAIGALRLLDLPMQRPIPRIVPRIACKNSSCGRANRSSSKQVCCDAPAGNASFHNDTTYTELKPSISSLVALLHDREEKVRGTMYMPASAYILRGAPCKTN
jgi:hypothetical protein